MKFKILGMSTAVKIIFLYTSVPNTAATEQQQRELLSILRSKGVDIDGANSDNKDLRSTLWALPNSKRAVYPQVYIKRNKDISCIGDFEEVVRLNDEFLLDAHLFSSPSLK